MGCPLGISRDSQKGTEETLWIPRDSTGFQKGKGIPRGSMGFQKDPKRENNTEKGERQFEIKHIPVMAKNGDSVEP